jgi:hypothetical protein
VCPGASAHRNWGKQDLIKEVKFTTNVTLLDNVAVVKFIMSYTGTITQVSSVMRWQGAFCGWCASTSWHHNLCTGVLR